MKIITGGDNIIAELNPEQLTILKKLLILKIEEYFPDNESNAGFMIFNSLKTIFNYENLYIEFFFNKKTNSVGTGKIILYDGLEPNEVLDAMCIIQKECNGFTTSDTTNDIKIKL